MGHFTSAQARERYLAAYDVAMRAWPEPRQEFDVPTSFGKVHVHRYGPETGTPFVLLHGAAGGASNWYPQIAALGEHHPVYAIDTIDDPGRSAPTRVVAGSQENARWLDETLAGLGLQAISLVGVSYGGFLALCLAVHRPQRLACVTLLDPGGLEKVPLRFYVTVLAGLPATLAPKRARPFFARLLANHALVMPPEHLAPVMLTARTWRTTRPAARPFTDDELRSIQVPMQVILAGRSILVRPRRVQKRLRRLGLASEIIRGAGHGLPLEQPGLINQRILDFTRRVRA
jgi:pimeloyl-ACP methyl ester carboxylesterase